MVIIIYLLIFFKETYLRITFQKTQLIQSNLLKNKFQASYELCDERQYLHSERSAFLIHILFWEN